MPSTAYSESLADPGALVSTLPLPEGWSRSLHACGNTAVPIVMATHPAGTLGIPFDVIGSHDVHFGVFRPRGKAASLQVRFPGERFWRKIEPHLYTDDAGGVLQNVTLKSVNLTAPGALEIRTEPGRTAALAFIRHERTDSPGHALKRGKAGAVIDANYLFSTRRIESPDDLLAALQPFVDSTFDRICWGTGAGSFRALYFSEVLPMLGENTEGTLSDDARLVADVMQMFRRENIDPLKLAAEFLQSNGLQIWANDRICHTFDPAKKRHLHLVSDFCIRNQHMRVLEKDGTPHAKATFSLAYPEFRELKIRFLCEQAAYGVDGIHLDFTRMAPVVGWEAPVIESFIAVHGFDPRKSSGDEWIRPWLAHQSSYVTLFLRELRAALSRMGSPQGKGVPISCQVQAGWDFSLGVPETYMDGLDIAAWAGEGLADIISCGGRVFHVPVRLDHINELVAGTSCELWSCIHHRAAECYPCSRNPDATLEAHTDPNLIVRSAADAYHQGADGVFLWEAGEVPSVPSRWDVLKHLGDRDRVTSAAGSPIGFCDGRHNNHDLRLDPREPRLANT